MIMVATTKRQPAYAGTGVSQGDAAQGSPAEAIARRTGLTLLQIVCWVGNAVPSRDDRGAQLRRWSKIDGGVTHLVVCV